MLLEELTNEQKDAVLAEVGYTRKQLDSDLEHIKDWLKLQHHLPPSRLTESDSFLTNYLAGCKGSLEKVKRKLDCYYTLRSHSEIFDCRDPLDPGYVAMSSMMFMAVTQNFSNGVPLRVSFSTGLPNADRQNAEFLPYIRRYISLLELLLRESTYWIQFCVLLDFKEIKTNDLMLVNPLLIRDFLNYFQQAMPLRYTKVYLINTPSYLTPLINNLIIPLLPKKHRQKIMLLEELTNEQKDAVLAEVGYTRKQLDSDLEHIKDWLKLQHHLPPSRLTESDSFLTNYLAGCKGSLEKVKRKLDCYYTLRSHSEIFDCRDPLDPGYVAMSSMMFMAVTQNFSNGVPLRVSFSTGLPNADRQNAEFLPYIRRYISLLELLLRESTYWIQFCVLLDFKEIKTNDLMLVNPLLIRDFLNYFQQAMPLRYTKVYLINTPSYLTPLINNLIIPLLPKKHRQKLYVTANGFEEVSQYFDKSILPSDFGGDLPPMKELSALWSDKEKERREWYLNELSERCDESKRIIPQDPTNSYFGVPGSLKKLVVD